MPSTIQLCLVSILFAAYVYLLKPVHNPLSPLCGNSPERNFLYSHTQFHLASSPHASHSAYCSPPSFFRDFSYSTPIYRAATHTHTHISTQTSERTKVEDMNNGKMDRRKTHIKSPGARGPPIHARNYIVKTPTTTTTGRREHAHIERQKGAAHRHTHTNAIALCSYIAAWIRVFVVKTDARNLGSRFYRDVRIDHSRLKGYE